MVSQLRHTRMRARRGSLAALILILIFFPVVSRGMEPPDPGEIDNYRLDGSLAERDAFAGKLANHQAHPDLVKRLKARLAAQEEGRSLALENLPYATGLPATGTPRIFTLLIEFPDYAHVNDASVFANKLFGTGDPAEQPRESLREYYKRSSYNLLDIQGDVLPWYTAAHDRWYYGPNSLIKEALQYYESSYDFAQYDNNGDGKIDFFQVCWTGPDNGWGKLWWAWCDLWQEYFGNDSFTVDGKRLGVFSWQWESRPVGTAFDAGVVIHVAGHGLGLPDLYDYDDTVGPRGGVGGLDNMDANWGDTNSFYKWILGWLTPTVISATDAPQALMLRPLSQFPDTVMIMHVASDALPFS